MGQLPLLEVDGQVLHQSIAIARYVAKRVGLAGANDWESLQIDIAVDTINDFRASKWANLSRVKFAYNILFSRSQRSLTCNTKRTKRLRPRKW